MSQENVERRASAEFDDVDPLARSSMRVWPRRRSSCGSRRRVGSASRGLMARRHCVDVGEAREESGPTSTWSARLCESTMDGRDRCHRGAHRGKGSGVLSADMHYVCAFRDGQDRLPAESFRDPARSPRSRGAVGARRSRRLLSLRDTARAMSQENVEIVQRFYDAWLRDEFPGPLSLWTPKLST